MANQSNISNMAQQDEGFTLDAQTKVTLFSILLVWSLLGNVLVIAVVFANRNLRTNFNHLIVNMAVSDLFIPLLILPMKIVEETNGPEWLVDGILGEALCKLCYFLSDISPAVSIFSLVIITVNRFVSIAYPIKIRKLRGRMSWILLVLTWLASMALLSPYFYTFHLIKDKGINHCVSQWSPAFDDLAARTIFIAIIIVVAFLLPLIAIVVLYSLMLYQLKKHSKNVVHMLNNRQLLSRQRRNKHIFYICIVIITSFVCLVGPFFGFMFVLNFVWRWNYEGETEHFNTILFIVQYLAYLNTAINPCIYFAFLKDYQQGLRRLLKGTSKRRSSYISVSTRGRVPTKVSLALECSLGKDHNRNASV